MKEMEDRNAAQDVECNQLEQEICAKDAEYNELLSSYEALEQQLEVAQAQRTSTMQLLENQGIEVKSESDYSMRSSLDRVN